jgi:hypothetical protein
MLQSKQFAVKPKDLRSENKILPVTLWIVCQNYFCNPFRFPPVKSPPTSEEIGEAKHSPK